MFIPTIVASMLSERKARIERERVNESRKRLEEFDKRTQYRSEISLLEQQIPLLFGIDLINYCANEGINPSTVQLERFELTCYSSWENNEKDILGYVRALGIEDYIKYKARLNAKNKGGKAIIYANENNSYNIETGSCYELTGQIVIPKK